MKVLTRIMVIAAVAVFVLSSATAAPAAVSLIHPPSLSATATPLSPNAVQQVEGTSGYRAYSCVYFGCHGSQADQINNNHGMSFRPITSNTVSVWSTNTYAGFLPPTANFKFGGQASGQTTASWAVGGMSIGSEMYVYQASAGSYDYPAVGNTHWQMDYDWDAPTGPNLPRGSFLPGYNNQPTLAEAFASNMSGINFFTGGTGGTPASNEVPCVKCHSYGSNIQTSGGVPTAYTIEEWGVTCINCHGNNVTQTHNTATNPVPFDSAICYDCHNRTPFEGSGINPARTQQIPMEVWENGSARNNYMQGYEMKDSAEASPHREAASPLSATSAQGCFRCHDAKGYMAHAQNGTDVPYFYSAVITGDVENYPVTATTKSGVDCSVCHTVHGGEQGLNKFGNRIPPLLSYDVGGPTDPAWRQCSDCHRVRVSIGSGSSRVLSYVGYGEQIDINNSMRGSSVHGGGQREMFLGYGGYGVTPVQSTHEAAGVWCQYCHMPNSVPEPYANRSHLFKIVEPKETSSSAEMDYGVYPASASGTTNPSTTETASFPDDSCTGSGCHLPSQADIDKYGLDAAQDAQKQFLQGRIDYWQTEIDKQLDSVAAAMAAVPVAGQSTDAYKMANINYSMVLSDASMGVHNFNYAHDLLDWAEQTFEDITTVQDTSMTVSVSNTQPDYTASVSISAVLKAKDTGNPIPGESVILERRTPGSGSWEQVIVLGSETGTYQYTLTNNTTAKEYRFVYNGRASTYLASISPTVLVKPHVRITPASPDGRTTIALNKKYSFFGQLWPRYPAGATNVWIRTAKKTGSTWAPLSDPGYAAPNENYADGTLYRKILKYTVRSPYKTQAYFHETDQNAATYSSTFTFYAK